VNCGTSKILLYLRFYIVIAALITLAYRFR